MNLTKAQYLSKRFLRLYLPSLYSLSYKMYKQIKGHPYTPDVIETYSKFTKADFYDFELDNIKFKIFLDPENNGVDRDIFTYKHYEPHILRAIRKNLDKDSIFLDIGGNIGQHSLFSSYFAKKVYSFEPITRIYNQMLSSINMNNIFNVVPYNIGIGDENTSLDIFGSDINMGGSSLITSENRYKVQTVKIFKLDDVFDKIGIEKVDLIKIDVEGFELQVLMGAKETIDMYKPKILIEYSPYFYNKYDVEISSKIFSFLKDRDYVLINLDKEGNPTINSLDEIINIDQTNILALRR